MKRKHFPLEHVLNVWFSLLHTTSGSKGTFGGYLKEVSHLEDVTENYPWPQSFPWGSVSTPQYNEKPHLLGFHQNVL